MRLFQNSETSPPAATAKPQTTVLDTGRLLAGNEGDTAMMHWEKNTAARRHTHRARACFFAATLLVLSSVLSFTYLQWQYTSEVPRPIIAESPSHLGPAKPGDQPVQEGPKRDLKLLLHLDEHVSRAPGTRQFSWNITKAQIAPDGVEKDVFLINSMTDSHHPAQFENQTLTRGRPIPWANNRGPIRRYPRD